VAIGVTRDPKRSHRAQQARACEQHLQIWGTLLAYTLRGNYSDQIDYNEVLERTYQRAELGRLRNPSENSSPSDQKSTGRVPSELRVASSCCARVPSEPRVAQAANGRVPSERGKNSGLARNSEGLLGPH